MGTLGCPRRLRLASVSACLLAAWLLGVAGAAEPLAKSPRWWVSYPALPGGRACESTAVPMTADGVLVTVVMPGANAQAPDLRAGEASAATRMIGHDPVSRLGFLRVQGQAVPVTQWSEAAGGALQGPLLVLTPAGAVRCRADGWTKQIGGKVLPLALLRLQFEGPVPPAGTAVVDGRGRVVALVFQPTGAGASAYAIPAEAVHRVCRDVCRGGSLVRGWLGLTLRSENATPQVVRVLPDSPAAAAGIRQSDVLLAVGSRRITHYADAADAFFYLIPGEPTLVKLRRGTQVFDVRVTPGRGAQP